MTLFQFNIDAIQATYLDDANLHVGYSSMTLELVFWMQFWERRPGDSNPNNSNTQTEPHFLSQSRLPKIQDGVKNIMKPS